MCDDTRLRFCTCDDTLAEPDWVLWRADLSIEPMHRRGRVGRPPARTTSRLAAIRELLGQLNAGNLFDFDYTPRDDDALAVRYGGHRLRFRVRGERWTEDRGNHLQAWRSRLVEEGRGLLEPPDERPHPQLDALLEAVDAAPNSEARTVLTDWAEENGRPNLAAWLREEARRMRGEVAGPEDDPGFRTVALGLSVRLRARLSRGPIEGCDQSGCPGRWEALDGRGLSRGCAVCASEVPFHDAESEPSRPRFVRAPSLPRREGFWAELLGTLF